MIGKIPLHGVIGFLMIVLGQVLVVFKIESFYFPVIWYGYILLVDGLVFMIKGKSLIKDYTKNFLALIPLSVFFWWAFEFLNKFIQNWQYLGDSHYSSLQYFLLASVSFSTVLPAIFETSDLINALSLFKKLRVKRKFKIKRLFLCSLICVGIISLILPIFFPRYTFPFVWLTFFFLLDPINYMKKQPSIIRDLSNGELGIPLSLLLSGIVCGFFWEFWNYWAIPKWVYSIPFFDFYRVFEMPMIGYIGYLPFAWELYAMYHFSRFLMKKIPKITFFKT